MYQKPNQKLWTGRLDSETDRQAFRHFQTVQFVDLDWDMQSMKVYA